MSYSCCIVITNDRALQPELPLFVAKRIDVTTTEVASGHLPMLFHPDLVIGGIRGAAEALQVAITGA